MKKRRLKKWVKNSLVIISSIVLYCLLSRYGLYAGVNYFYATLVLIGWTQLCIVNPILLFCIDENLI